MTIDLIIIDPIKEYLKSSEVINFNNTQIKTTAKQLAHGLHSDSEIAKSCFEFVLHNIDHSVDYKKDGKSCTALAVLQQGHGFCYAKSHLLVALLRANNIPAGFCYQRITTCNQADSQGQFKYCLHGLVAIYLPLIDGLKNNNGWYRVDPRGNKPNINAKFSPPTEQLAYQITHMGEKDFPQVFAEPLFCVVDVLSKFNNYQSIMDNLPDSTDVMSI